MAFQIDRVNANTTSSVRRLFGPVWAAAAALALTFAAVPSAAQDVPWGKKPTASKPAPKKPVANKPVAQKPAAQKPVAKKPVAQKPVANKPVAEKPATPVAKQALAPKEAAKPDAAPPQEPAAPVAAGPLTNEQLLDHFHKALAPHGSWHKDSTYGEVWVPSEKEVGKNFSPYVTDGRWGLTPDGAWAWASDHQWGNIPFHYGRWVKTKDKRNAWLPGTSYAPAWVVWRTANDARQFVGWAPMAPLHHWLNNSSEDAWTFVPTRNLFGPKVENFVIRDKQMAATMLSQSRVLPSQLDGPAAQAGALKAASPSLKDGNVPHYATPRVTLSLTDHAIAPITAETLRLANAPKPVAAPAEAPVEAVPVPDVVAVQQPSSEAPVAPAVPADVTSLPGDVDDAPEGRFATPPDDGRFATPPRQVEIRLDRRHRRHFGRSARAAARRSMVVRRARIRRALRANRQGAQHQLPVYRCGWTDGRPRKWRCGPTTVAPRGIRR